jgi:hypothetical protein
MSFQGAADVVDERQLQWIQRNTGRRGWGEAAPIGELAQKLLDSPQLKAPVWQRRLLAVLQEHAGEDFLKHVVPISVRKGVLTFQVGEPTILYHFRLQWEQRLLRLLQAVPEAGICSIRFTTISPR